MSVKTNEPVGATSEAVGVGALDTDHNQAENGRDFVSGRRINIKSSVDKGSQIESGQSDFEREEEGRYVSGQQVLSIDFWPILN